MIQLFRCCGNIAIDLEFQDTLPLTLLLIVEYLQQLRNPKIDLGQNPEVFYESHLDWMMVQCRFYIQTIGVDVHCWDLKIHAFFTVTRAGKGWGAAYLECLSVWQGKGAAVPMGCPQPPALSQPGCHAHVTKKSHQPQNMLWHQQQWRACESAELTIFRFCGEKFGVLFIFFKLYLLWLVLFHFCCQIRRKFLNGCYLSFVYPA